MSTQPNPNDLNSLVNGQITDAVNQTLTMLLGQSTAYSFGLIDTVMSDTLGMTMHNAVTAQQNQQIIANATLSAACAQMLKAKATVSSPPINVSSLNPSSPNVSSVAQNPRLDLGGRNDTSDETPENINSDTQQASRYVGDLIKDLTDSNQDSETARESLEDLRNQINQALG